MKKRILHTSAVTTLAVAVSLGALAPASSAAPANQPIRKVQTVKTVKATKVNSLVDIARRKVVAEISRDDSHLSRVLDRPSVRSTDGDAQHRLGLSVAEDRALLAGFAERARAAGTLVELRKVAALVRQLRPEIYSVAVGQVHDLAALATAAEDNAATLAKLRAAVAEHETAALDVSAVRADLMSAGLLNSEATLALPAAREAALVLTAMSSRVELQLVTTEVHRTWGLLDRVDAAIMLTEMTLAASMVEPLEPAAIEEPAPTA